MIICVPVCANLKGLYVNRVFWTDLSSAMALKLSTVTEQKSLWRNLIALQSSRVWSHQQQRGLAPRATSKGMQTRLAQIPEHARFLMKRLVTDLKTFVQQVHHNMVAFPVGRRKEMKSFRLKLACFQIFQILLYIFVKMSSSCLSSLGFYDLLTWLLTSRINSKVS